MRKATPIWQLTLSPTLATKCNVSLLANKPRQWQSMLPHQGWFNLLIYATFTRTTNYRVCNLHIYYIRLHAVTIQQCSILHVKTTGDLKSHNLQAGATALSVPPHIIFFQQDMFLRALTASSGGGGMCPSAPYPWVRHYYIN